MKLEEYNQAEQAETDSKRKEEKNLSKKDINHKEGVKGDKKGRKEKKNSKKSTSGYELNRRTKFLYKSKKEKKERKKKKREPMCMRSFGLQG